MNLIGTIASNALTRTITPVLQIIFLNRKGYQIIVSYNTTAGDITGTFNEYSSKTQTKLLSSCLLCIREACLALIKLSRCLNLDKNRIKHLLDRMRRLFPTDIKLPRTATELMKIIGMYNK
ncbi:unnamed protein product [Rotaria sordida]|uniref:Uncharacterized protein n=1 Tax=Rotaria sordida TaxID=392033 RepID=A0A815G4Z9_9BILA|nr:unnamed protein product [Rotaria sordida]CAF4043956.1 unnamed protein product [Rotaria sordida]